MVKNMAWILVGIVVGIVGFYFVTKEPNVVKPTTPSNVAIMLKQGLDNNDIASVKYLMTSQQRDNFSESDLQSLRQYIQAGSKAEAGTSLDDYVVMTFANKQAITLWLAPPMGKSHMWQIQKISKGAVVSNAYSQP